MLINYSNSAYKIKARPKRVSGNSIFILAVAIACAIYIFSASSSNGSTQRQGSQTAFAQEVMSMNND